MPAKPAWHGKLDQIVTELEALPPGSSVNRSTLEFLLGVGPRRAQQIMAACVTERVGTSSLADRDLLCQYLRQLAAGNSGFYESQRQRRVAAAIEELRQVWVTRPKVWVEAPAAIVNQKWEALPEGVDLQPGRITIRFETSQEALQKMLALAMAVGSDMLWFEEEIRTSRPLPRPDSMPNASSRPSPGAQSGTISEHSREAR
jgi:hypothetical protein